MAESGVHRRVCFPTFILFDHGVYVKAPPFSLHNLFNHNAMQYKDLVQLKSWFENEKRDFPWREDTSPYSVWVSEVMLQQTQAAVVKDYYNRWMKLFPSIRDLADAPLEKVIKAWEGLGYYSRARSLHEGALFVQEHFGGVLPSAKADLAKIKGLGPYTIGAIRSFAFRQRAAAVDGNVIRVLARYYKIHEDVARPATVNQIRNLAEDLLPNEEPWVVSEALIELGALVCSKKPKCGQCPLQNNCQAYRDGVARQLPVKTSKSKIQRLYRAVPVIFCKGKALVRKCGEGEIMSGLHEFPYFETGKEGILIEELGRMVAEQLGVIVENGRQLPDVPHSFTRFQVRLRPVYFLTRLAADIRGYAWLSDKEMAKAAFSSGHRRIYRQLLEASVKLTRQI